MRGKHGSAAQNRRDRAELERRAEQAERRAERLEQECDAIKSSSRSQMQSLRAELARARKDRDVAAAPALEQAEARIRVLIAELDGVTRKYEKNLKQWQNMTSNLKEVLKGMGLSPGEAIEAIIAAIEPDGKTPSVTAPGTVQRRDMPIEQALAIGRAQGWRGSSDRLADRRIREEEKSA
ncbi:hypothetical protein [Streptomyces sp. NPDC000351]|uniref:hypothetical protein n=1 Tax=Streptomyces sp. NPDC000351 TaxID=3154250 RepID=UPI00332F7AD9